VAKVAKISLYDRWTIWMIVWQEPNTYQTAKLWLGNLWLGTKHPLCILHIYPLWFAQDSDKKDQDIHNCLTCMCMWKVCFQRCFRENAIASEEVRAGQET
jgi:hypothetical protein